MVSRYRGSPFALGGQLAIRLFEPIFF